MALLRFLMVGLCLMWGAGLAAQTAQLNFAGLNADPQAPVEMSADTLRIRQSDGNAVFTGNVVIGQADLRLTADKVVVSYSNTGGVDRLQADGNVLFVTATDAAEAQSADYSLKDQRIILRGDVLLTQGESAIMAQVMNIDIATGDATMEGRVRSVLQPSAN